MKLFAGLEAIVKTDEPLAPYTWFRIGGPAKYFVCPRTVEELQDVVKRCRENSLPIHVLGGGANLLIDDAGVKGAVIHLRSGFFNEVTFMQGGVRANAGADMGKLVLKCVHDGLAGLECMTGIPGTVGGCVRMNAGGTFGDIGSVVEAVHVMNEDGEIFTLYRPDLNFSYRSAGLGSKFILGAEMRLVEDDPHRILKQVKQIWISKKNTQPLGKRSAGCVFRNPSQQASAGMLIDRVGLKGKRVGGAYVSEKHANFILADEGATAGDVLKLINLIRDAVHKANGVYLELEIEVW